MRITNAERMPCGCLIGEGPNKEFVIEPCRLDCRTLDIAVELSKQQEKSVEYRFGRAVEG